MDKPMTMTRTRIGTYGCSTLPDGPIVAPIFDREADTDSKVINHDAGILWSGTFPVPAIGDRTTISMNQIGPGVVVGYLVEYGWLGLMVKPDNPPEWFVRQTGQGKYPGIAMVFGLELKR